MTSMLRPFILGSLVTLLLQPVHAAVQLLNLVEEESPLVLYVRDVPAFMKVGAESPWAKTWNDAQMQKFLAPLRAKMKIDRWDEECSAETGYTVTELLAMAQGQVLLAVTSNEIFELGEHPDPSRIPLLIGIEVGDNAGKIAKIIGEKVEKKHQSVREEDYAGVQIHIHEKDAEKGGGEEFVWAMADGIWFISPSKQVIQKVVDRAKEGRATSPLGESERFLRIRKQAPEADLTLVCNIQSMYPAIKQAADKNAAQSPGKGMGIPPGVVMDSLGLDALQDLYLTVTMNSDATLVDGGITCTEQRGIMKLLAFNDGPVPQPVFVSEKWVNAGSTCFSLPSAYAGLKEILAALNPMFASMYQAKVKELNQQLGVDLEQDLMGSLGAHLVSAKALRPGANPDVPPPVSEFDQMVALSLDNAPAFTKAIEAIKRMAGPQVEKMFVKREYLGQSIFTFIPPGAAQQSVSYSITPKYLFFAVGSPAILETAIQGLDGKRPSLWKKPEVKAALAEIPAKACSFEFQDNRAMIGSMVETLAQLGNKFNPPAATVDGEDEAAGDNPVKSTEGPFDLSAKPDPAVIGKYWSISTGYAWRDSNGLYLKSKVHHSK